MEAWLECDLVSQIVLLTENEWVIETEQNLILLMALLKEVNLVSLNDRRKDGQKGNMKVLCLMRRLGEKLGVHWVPHLDLLLVTCPFSF